MFNNYYCCQHLLRYKERKNQVFFKLLKQTLFFEKKSMLNTFLLLVQMTSNQNRMLLQHIKHYDMSTKKNLNNDPAEYIISLKPKVSF